MHAAVSTVNAIADRMTLLEKGHDLEKAGAEFMHALKMVSCFDGGLSRPDFETLQATADRVIEGIEQHLATHHDRELTVLGLVEIIYGIRQRVEAIELWQRHSQAFAASRRAS